MSKFHFLFFIFIILLTSPLLAFNHSVDMPEYILQGKMFLITHTFEGLEIGDTLVITEEITNSRFSTWQVIGSNRSLQQYNQSDGVTTWHITASEPIVQLGIHYFSKLYDMEYFFNATADSGYYDIIYDEIYVLKTDQCLGHMLNCEGGSQVIVKECVNGTLIETGKECPRVFSFGDKLLLIICLLGFGIILILKVLKKDGKKKDN
jgi:hypothetical protein